MIKNTEDKFLYHKYKIQLLINELSLVKNIWYLVIGIIVLDELGIDWKPLIILGVLTIAYSLYYISRLWQRDLKIKTTCNPYFKELEKKVKKQE